jgi:nucleoside-triphosphatase THEP1
MTIAYVSLPGRGRTDALLAEVVGQLEQIGVSLAGTVQTNPIRSDRTRCDMDLRVLPDGPVLRISQDLGEGGRGCRLDAGVLETAVLEVGRRLEGASLLVVNKFGKQEAAGRGFAPVIGEALARGIPVLVGVNGLNLGPFLTFAGGLAEPLPPEPKTIVAWAVGAARSAAS